VLLSWREVSLKRVFRLGGRPVEEKWEWTSSEKNETKEKKRGT